MRISNMLVNIVRRNLLCFSKFISYLRYLKEHIYVHTKDKPYVCGIGDCKKRFRQAGKLSLHRRTHKEYPLKRYARKGTVKQNDNIKEFDFAENKKLNEPINNPQSVKDSCFDEAEREFIRQDTGQTTATANAKEFRLEDIKEDDWADIGAIEEQVEEVVEEKKNDKMEENEGNMLEQFLNHMNSPLMLTLRPKLPVPFKIEDKPELKAPDLLTWIKPNNSISM